MAARSEVRSILSLVLPIFECLRQGAEYDLLVVERARRAAEARTAELGSRRLEIERETTEVRADLPGAGPAEFPPGLVAARQNYLLALAQQATETCFELGLNKRRLERLALESAGAMGELGQAARRRDRTGRDLALLRLTHARLRQRAQEGEALELREMSRRVAGDGPGGPDD